MFPIHLFVKVYGLYTFMDFVIDMPKRIPRRYAIGFAAATLAAAITSAAFLNCKKLGEECQSLGEVV